MPKTKISEYSATANSNTDVASINIDEGCAPSGINNAIRAIMGHLKDFQSGTSNDPFTVGSSGSLTLSYGTANGVAYLNGSKVLTTSSALVFDGTNLGLGGTNNSYGSQTTMTLSGTNVSRIDFRSNSTFTGTILSYQAVTEGLRLQTEAGYPITFYPAGTKAATIDTAGNLGIGTTSITSGGGWTPRLVLAASSGSPAWIIKGASNQELSIGASESMYIDCTGATTGANNNIIFRNTSTNSSFTPVERARIDSSGNLLVGTTSTLGNGGGITVATSGANIQTLTTNSTSSSAYYIGRFYSGGTEKGSIYYNGTLTAYNTTSDYRLKENVAPLVGALQKISQLKPCSYTWKENGNSGEGFIAHELAEVFPDAVTGEKDAVNEDGSIKPQGIDTSFLVATLTAAIQEQQAIIQSLTARITALESA